MDLARTLLRKAAVGNSRLSFASKGLLEDRKLVELSVGVRENAKRFMLGGTPKTKTFLLSETLELLRGVYGPDIRLLFGLGGALKSFIRDRRRRSAPITGFSDYTAIGGNEHAEFQLHGVKTDGNFRRPWICTYPNDPFRIPQENRFAWMEDLDLTVYPAMHLVFHVPGKVEHTRIVSASVESAARLSDVAREAGGLVCDLRERYFLFISGQFQNVSVRLAKGNGPRLGESALQTPERYSIIRELLEPVDGSVVVSVDPSAPERAQMHVHAFSTHFTYPRYRFGGHVISGEVLAGATILIMQPAAGDVVSIDAT